MVNVDAVKVAIRKLKDTNLLYQKVDEHRVDDVARQVIETIETIISTMLAKATKEDVSEFFSPTPSGL